jgi:predicted transglutaminase-like cysteine proteinase
MSVFISRALARTLTRILVLSCFSIAAIEVAAAKPRAKKSRDTGVPISVGIAPPQTPAHATARSFTIDGVLARRDGGLDGSPRLASINPAGTVTDAPAPRSALAAPTGEPFGLGTFRAPEGALWVKWRQAESALGADRNVVTACRNSSESCSPAARRYVELIDIAKSLTGRARFGHVNRAVNVAVRFVSDMTQHGVMDLWSSPVATMTSGRGDCEDYAIAKYFILREAGIAAEDLQLVLVRDNVVRQDHAVLAVREDGRWLVLDNRSNLMLEPTELTSLTPLFTLDHRGVSMFAAPYAPRRTVDTTTTAAAHGVR